MIRISELSLNFLLNATWQIAVVTLVALVCSRLLSNVAARYRHALWVASLLLCIALPVWSLFALTGKVPNQLEEQPKTAPRWFENSTLTRKAPPVAEITVAPKESSPALSQLFQNRRQPVVTNSSLLLALASGYAFFVLYRIGRLWRSWRRTQGLRRSIYRWKIPARMTVVAAQCQAALRLKNVPLVCSTMARAPVTLGGHKPLIILPESWYREFSRELLPKLSPELSDDTLCSVLGHEMAHIARHDFALNLVYEFLLLPISFHPLTKFVKRQIDRTRELACDEMVTELLLEPKAHARSLVRVAGSLIIPADQAFMLGIFDADILEERIMKLTQNTRRLGLRAGRLLALTALSLLCFACLTISTFSFELRSERGDGARVKTFAMQEVALQSSDQLNGQTQTSAQQTSRATPTRAETERALTSGSPQERAQAACDAGKRNALEAIPLLVSMLGDDTRIEPLKCWTEGRWNPALDSFKQPSPGEQAAIALASMGTPAFRPLTNALAGPNSSAVRNAAWAIGELTNMLPDERADAVMPLIFLLGDSDGWVRMAAARALGELRDERAGERLVAALLDSEGGVRQISAWALGEMKDERAVQTLCNVLVSDRQSDVRLAAAEALGEIRSQKAVASLTQALNDSEPRVRAKARWAIAEIEDSDG